MMSASDFFIVPMFFCCFFTPVYWPFRFFNGVRKSFLMRAGPGDFRVHPFGGVFLVVVASVVTGCQFGRGDGVLLSFMSSLLYGFLLVFALVLVLRFVIFLFGKFVGMKEMFSLVVFSLFLPVSLMLWLESKGIGDFSGFLLLYSLVCVVVSCVRVLSKSD